MNPPTPQAAAHAPKHHRKRHLFSLRIKFILVLTLLIGAVMSSVTWLVLHQVRATLVRQVLDRGAAQVKSLALNSVDPLLAHSGQEAVEDVSLLTLMQLTRDAVQAEPGQSGSRDSSAEEMPPWEKTLFDSLDLLNARVQKTLWPGEGALLGDVEYAVLTDKEGRIVAVRTLTGTTEDDLRQVAEKAPYRLPESVRALPEGQKAEGKVDSQAYRGPDGRTFFHLQAPILARSSANEPPVPIGMVHLGMNQNSILRVERTVAVTIILITAIFLALGIAFTALFVTFLVKPIGLLVDGVTAIAAGDLDQRIGLKRSDELGDLTDAFNDMAFSLREKELLKGAFSKYVTKSVVDRIMANEGGLKLGGEKKEVTVFFSDIRGFTPMSEQLRPEEVVSLLNEYFTEMVKIIFKYEGTLDKFMGDAIMAVFGAPVDVPNHAEHAVLAALEMSEKMKLLRAKWRSEGKKEVNIGIGINTGEVVVGNLGSNERMEYTAIGDNVNLAQRLESVAEGGQILISSATYERVKGKVTARVLEPIKLKGKAEKVVPYEVVGLRV